MTMFPPPTHDSTKAKMLRAVHPSYGYCGRCGMPWSNTTEHQTRYSESSLCFPLCEYCWALLGHPEARIGYYATLLDVWEQGHPVELEVRRAVGQAVAAGR